jgi:hypothetical protein
MDEQKHMDVQKRFVVIELPDLRWPTSLQFPWGRFRLFVATDSRSSSEDAISEFVSAALKQGMAYCCIWGLGCKRFRDIVEEIVVQDSLSERKFVRPRAKDAILTTWHPHESLEAALRFFATSAQPARGFVADSDFRVVACVGNPERTNGNWAMTACRVLGSTQASH